MNFGEDERQAYEEHLKWLMVESNTLKKYQEIGEQIGLEKGEQIGLEKVAKELIIDGMAIEKVAKLIKLSIEHVKMLAATITR